MYHQQQQQRKFTISTFLMIGVVILSSSFKFIKGNELLATKRMAEIKGGGNNNNNNSQNRRLSCAAELGSANRTIADWSVKVRQMISDSSAQGIKLREDTLREEIKLHQMIAEFGARLNRKPIEKLVKDLSSIKRQSNRVSLDAYLKTYDARWPQNSVQLGVAVERVQQACLSTLDRATMMVLNSSNDINNYLNNNQNYNHHEKSKQQQQGGRHHVMKRRNVAIIESS